MRSLQDFRDAKPAFYPDHTIHAEFACAHFGLRFTPLDGPTGLLFKVASASASHCFGGGRCYAFPQNDATAATLASDKYFTQRILEEARVSTLSGQYFFLHSRHRGHRPSGHERADATTYFAGLDHHAFAKPLNGSRGDFARPLTGPEALAAYMDEVAQFYDSIVLQPIVRGDEYRIFLLDAEEIFTVRKFPPILIGNGVHSLHELLAEHDRDLQLHGLSPTGATLDAADEIFPLGERYVLPGRMNRSAGGTMAFARARHHGAAAALARRAARALNLRAAAVDLFVNINGDPAAMAVIEINANPSIRFLEESEREDLILTIWRHTFASIGLLDV
jgi:D-alanine-D-alanine ligase-like ATP-grasp enzyme